MKNNIIIIKDMQCKDHKSLKDKSNGAYEYTENGQKPIEVSQIVRHKLVKFQHPFLLNHRQITILNLNELFVFYFFIFRENKTRNPSFN